MTFNLNKHNRDLDGITSILQKEDPDIVAFQELAPEVGSALFQDLRSIYPHSTLRLDQFEETQGILSKFELDEISTLPNSFFLSAMVYSPHGDLFLINVHAPKISPYRWKEGWEEQRQFIQELLALTSSIRKPVLLVGDFNLTLLSENYELLTEDFHDAFMETGLGFGFTFPTRKTAGIKLPLPVIRIDYIFHDGKMISHETRVLPENGGSDHRPVISVLSFNKQSEGK
jgi:endonuclease/exonuclease/phosphatase (EEP) superfamily protein YafD